MTQYRLLVHRDVLQYLRTLERAAATQQPGGLRDRELRALKAGLRAIANGEEEHFEGKRLGFTTHDLSDCAEIKLPVVPETRGNRDLGPSHRLIYREFEPEDGGPPYREVICFQHRGDNRPFDDAARRVGRAVGVRRETLNTFGASSDIAPIRQALPPDLRKALAAASDVAPARSAINARPSHGKVAPQRTDRPPGREL